MDERYIVVSRCSNEKNYSEEGSGEDKGTAIGIAAIVKKNHPEKMIKVWREITCYEDVELPCCLTEIRE